MGQNFAAWCKLYYLHFSTHVAASPNVSKYNMYDKGVNLV